MENIDNATLFGIIVTILGTIASLLGAVLSIRSEKKAKSSAEQALKAQKSIMKRQSTSELSILLNEAKRIQKIFSKYQISPKGGAIEGVDFQKDSQEFSEFLLSYNEKRGILENTVERSFQVQQNEMNKFLENFSNSPTNDDRKENGKNIVLCLNRIVSSIKLHIDTSNSEIE